VEYMRTGQVYTGYAWSNLREQRPLGRPRRELEGNIEMDIYGVR